MVLTQKTELPFRRWLGFFYLKKELAMNKEQRTSFKIIKLFIAIWFLYFLSPCAFAPLNKPILKKDKAPIKGFFNISPLISENILLEYVENISFRADWICGKSYMENKQEGLFLSGYNFSIGRQSKYRSNCRGANPYQSVKPIKYRLFSQKTIFF